MKWALWLFNVVMTLGMIAVFVALYYSCRYTIAKYQPAPAVNTPQLNFPTPVIKTPRNNAEYQGIVNNCLFYQERKMPTPPPIATPPSGSGTATPGGATPVPPAPQSEPLVNLKYVTHFVNWGTPLVHLEVMANPQTGVSYLEKLGLNDEFRHWKVCEISARRVVLKGIIKNEEVYHIFSPALNPTGQQITRQVYANLLLWDAEAKKGGLPASTATTPEDLLLPPPKPAPATAKNGVWIEKYPNGNKKEEGPYVNNSREGLWRCYGEDGTLHETGEYKNNEKTGKWVTYNPDGTKEAEGVYANGKRVGTWRVWGRYDEIDGKYYKVKDDEICEEIFKDGRLVEYRININPPGSRNTATPDSEIGIGVGDGSPPVPAPAPVKDGSWVERYPNGNKKEEGQYINKSREGLWSFYGADGKLRETCEYLNNEKSGKWNSYHPNGTIESEGTYVNGKSEGTWKTRLENGDVYEAYYKDGKMVGNKLFKKNP